MSIKVQGRVGQKIRVSYIKLYALYSCGTSPHRRYSQTHKYKKIYMKKKNKKYHQKLIKKSVRVKQRMYVSGLIR